ncbi:hypothetical protein I552_0582 [Mycobacterium xenopi 3993]|nr:hypothetical protein I552_0582 [Mycobacterium xenopi 3993]
MSRRRASEGGDRSLMPRLMAVSLTEAQVVARTKTVTRRMGWRNLAAGERLTFVPQGHGRRRASRWCGSSTSRWSRFDGSLWPRSPRLTVRWKAFQR